MNINPANRFLAIAALAVTSCIAAAHAANEAVTWTGAIDSNWDLTSENWINGNISTLFANGDTVTFDDSGVASAPVTVIPDGVSIDGITVDGQQDWTFSGGAIGGSGGLTMNGSGTVIFTNDNTFTGTTAINSGTVQLGNGGTSGSLNGHIDLGANTLVFYRSGNIQVGDVGIDNALTGTADSQVVFKGINSINQSSYKYTGNDEGFFGKIVIESGARLILENRDTAATNAITVEDAGQIFLATNRIYNNSITISGEGWHESFGYYGAIRLGGGTRLDGDVTLAGNSRIGAYQAHATISGTISGHYDLDINAEVATLTLTGVNTYTGATTITQGTLALSGDGSIAASSGVDTTDGTAFDVSGVTDSASVKQLTGNGSVILGAKSLIVGSGNTDATFSGVISDSGAGGSVKKMGTGTWTLTGTADLQSLAVDEGGLRVDGGISLTNGDVRIASTAILSGTGTISGNVDFNSGSVFEVNLTDAMAGKYLTVGTATLDGTISFTNWSASQLAVGASFVVLAGLGEGAWNDGTEFTNWLSGEVYNHELNSYTLVYDNEQGQVRLEVVGVVPEPATAALGLIGLAGLMIRRHRRL